MGASVTSLQQLCEPSIQGFISEFEGFSFEDRDGEPQENHLYTSCQVDLRSTGHCGRYLCLRHAKFLRSVNMHVYMGLLGRVHGIN